MSNDRALRVIFFDAAGTLFHLPRGVGFHYADVGRRHGLELDPAKTHAAFRQAWHTEPTPETTRVRRPLDDRDWWRRIVDRVLDAVAGRDARVDREAYFDEVYLEFTRPGVWTLYPETLEVLETLRGRFSLGVISNWDGRLRPVLEQLGILPFFSTVHISTEVGADKPDPWIFEEALRANGLAPHEAMHVGDEPAADWEGATNAGLHAFRLHRPENSLADLLARLDP